MLKAAGFLLGILFIVLGTVGFMAPSLDREFFEIYKFVVVSVGTALILLAGFALIVYSIIR